MKLLGEGVDLVPLMVEQMYAPVDRRLWRAAERSVQAHLIDMEARGLVRRNREGWLKC